MFIFKFLAVLNYRRQLVNAREQEFAQSKRTWEREREKLEHFYALWQQALKEWRFSHQRNVGINEIQLYLRYTHGLKKDISAQAEKVKQCLEEVEKKREVLLEASKSKEIMEKLEEQNRKVYLQEQSSKEKKFIDEVSVQRFSPKGNNQ
jgi:flagellar FliJ protein